ncbi:type II toxin-antitoxin system PemK/MazF family toxin [bacterium]|nr:type II toxin-antitoxin system PemK/MazF family toxin [bacterium]
MVKSGEFIPQRGDIIRLIFNPQAGHEQAGLRPVVTISPAAYNGIVNLALCCPITRQIKGYPFEVPLPETLKTSGTVLSDQLKFLDWKIRKAQFIEKLPSHILEEILAKINTLFG